MDIMWTIIGAIACLQLLIETPYIAIQLLVFAMGTFLINELISKYATRAEDLYEDIYDDDDDDKKVVYLEEYIRDEYGFWERTY